MIVTGDWRRARLGSLIVAKYGKALPQAERKGGEVPVYGSNGIVGWHDEALTLGGGTIVIGRKGSSGEVNFSASPCWPIDTTYFVDEPGPFRIEFLDYLLRSLNLTQLDRSTAIPGLNRNQFYDIEVPVPPDVDQAMIVSLLKEFDDHRSKAGRHLVSASRTIGRFRQAVLAATCSGRLTADWRDVHSSENAETLLKALLEDAANGKPRKSHNNAEGSQEFAPETWRTCSGHLAFTYITSGSRGWAKFYSEDGPLFIRVGNLDRYTWHLDLAEVQHVTPPSSAEGTRTRVQPGDILISITAEIGMVGVAPSDLGEAYVNQHVAIGRPNPRFSSEFLALFLASPTGGEKQFRTLERGATKTGLGLEDIRSLSIPVPPFEEQVEIVRRVERLFALAAELQLRIDAANARIVRSSQAVLAKAFRGELLTVSPIVEGADG